MVGSSSSTVTVSSTKDVVSRVAPLVILGRLADRLVLFILGFVIIKHEEIRFVTLAKDVSPSEDDERSDTDTTSLWMTR